jgi:prepilin-type processing-associated H-X9-DG protein
MPSAGWQWTALPTFKNGVPGISPEQDTGWAFQILPYLEQGNIHVGGTATSDRDKAVFVTGQTIKTYFCPSRHATLIAGLHDKGGNTHYVNYSGANPARQTIPGTTNIMRGMIDYAGSCQDTLTWNLTRNNVTIRIVTGTGMGHGPFARTDFMGGGVPSRTTIGFEGINDGTSNVIMVTEKRLPPTDYGVGPWNNDTGFMTGWDGDTLIQVFKQNNAGLPWPPIPDTARQANGQYVTNDCCDGSRAGSAHPAGMNAVMCDGSVRLISYNIDFNMYAFLAFRNDGQPVSNQ